MKSTVVRFFSERWDPISSALFGVVSFVLFLPFSRLDFDLHHDGYMTAAARAVADGRVIHRDVFMQYGPLLTLLQSVVTALPFPSALALRVFNALLLAVAVGLIADMGRRAPSTLGVSRIGAKIAALLVLVFADFFVGVPMLPWPSTLLVLLLVAHVNLLVVGLCFSESSHQPKSTTYLVFSGVSLGLVFFVRPVIFVALFIGLLAVLLMGIWSRQRVSGAIGISATGAAVTAVMGMLLLAILGALGPWWEQNFAWGSSYLGQSNQWTDAAVAQIRAYLPLFLVLLLCGVVLVVLSKISSLTVTQVRFLNLAVLGIALGATLLFTQLRRGHGMWVASPFQELSISALMVVVYWVVVAVTMAAAFCALVMLIARKASVRHLMLLWVCGVSAVSLTQSFPVPDSRHYYWALAPAVVLIPLLTGFMPTLSRRVLLVGGAVVALVSGATSLHATVDYLDTPRIAGPTGAINEGMLSSPVGTGFLTNFNESFEFLSSVLPAGEPVLFLTPDGANAAFDGNYRSADEWFVNWGPVPPLSERLEGVRFVITDWALPEQDLATLTGAGFTESASTGRLRFFERSTTAGE